MATTDTIVRGDSRTYYIDVSINGVPLDVTGYTAWFTAKYAPTDADTAAAVRKGMSSSLTGVTIIADPATGINSRIQVQLGPADTASIPAKATTLHYDVQIKTPSGDIYTVTRGDLQVLPDITNTTT